jgi:YggT family protein
MVLTFVRDVTDPYLNLFRRFIPPVRMGPGALDLSPMVAIIVLWIVGGIIVGLVRG